MNVLLDTTPLSNANAIRGVGRYTQELYTNLTQLQSDHHFFTSTDSIKEPIDIVHYPFFDFFFPTLPFKKHAKTVVTIHDVIPLLFPKHYPKGIKGTINYVRQRLALRTVSHIITDSESSKRDIIDHLKIKPEKMSVVYLAASSGIKKPLQATLDAVRKRYQLPKNYALYVGDINYNKNLPFLIHVMQKTPKLSLVLVGKALNNVAIPEGKALHQAITMFEMEKRVQIIDDLSGEAMEDLSAIYAQATLYIQPSLYEGFGLPVLEAMQCRVPVVCARAGSLPEVAGDAAVYFHPMEIEDCRQAIEKVLHYSTRQYQAMVRKGSEQASRFNWQQTAKQTLSVYEKVNAA